MTDEEDINDAFDSIALAEQSLSLNGFQGGKLDGREQGLKEGYHLGYHRGAEIGAEIGYYSAFAKYYLKLKTDLNPKTSASLKKLQDFVDSIPHENTDFDIHGAASEARALYKKCCISLKINSQLPFKQEFDNI